MEKNEKIGTQKLVKNGWSYFHLTVLNIFLSIDTPKNSTDLDSLGPQHFIAGLESAIAHREGTLSCAQSWKILKNTHLVVRGGL